MKKLFSATIFLLTVFLVFGSAYAEEKKLEQGPWAKMAFNFGGFLSSTNTSFRFGGGAGVDIDVENLLNLDSTNNVFRFDWYWRFSDNRKHRLDLSWFSFNRSGETTIAQGIEIPEQQDDGYTTIPAGTNVASYFNLDIYQAAYSYSFFHDDRLDVAARVGLYVMPISFGFQATGLIDEERDASFTAPLPTLGFRMDIAVTPKWYVRTGTQIFYLQYQKYKGSIMAFQGALEYVPWKHFGIGLGVDSFVMAAEADGEDYPMIDFTGYVEFSYVGLQLYATIPF